eukprot:391614_1
MENSSPSNIFDKTIIIRHNRYSKPLQHHDEQLQMPNTDIIRRRKLVYDAKWTRTGQRCQWVNIDVERTRNRKNQSRSVSRIAITVVVVMHVDLSYFDDNNKCDSLRNC